MHQDHRLLNGLNEWNRVPNGYVQLDHWDRIEGLDVQQINAAWYREYPRHGQLVGCFVGNGRWFRKQGDAGR